MPATTEGPYWAMTHHVAQPLANVPIVAKYLVVPGKSYSTLAETNTIRETP